MNFSEEVVVFEHEHPLLLEDTLYQISSYMDSEDNLSLAQVGVKTMHFYQTGPGKNRLSVLRSYNSPSTSVLDLVDLQKRNELIIPPPQSGRFYRRYREKEKTREICHSIRFYGSTMYIKITTTDYGFVQEEEFEGKFRPSESEWSTLIPPSPNIWIYEGHVFEEGSIASGGYSLVLALKRVEPETEKYTIKIVQTFSKATTSFHNFQPFQLRMKKRKKPTTNGNVSEQEAKKSVNNNNNNMVFGEESPSDSVERLRRSSLMLALEKFEKVTSKIEKKKSLKKMKKKKKKITRRKHTSPTSRKRAFHNRKQQSCMDFNRGYDFENRRSRFLLRRMRRQQRELPIYRLESSPTTPRREAKNGQFSILKQQGRKRGGRRKRVRFSNSRKINGKGDHFGDIMGKKKKRSSPTVRILGRRIKRKSELTFLKSRRLVRLKSMKKAMSVGKSIKKMEWN